MIKDKGKIYISADEIKSICQRLGKQIQADYKDKDLIVICVLKGSVVFTADLVRAIDLPLKIDFVRLSSYGSATVSSGTVRVLKDISMNITGKHVLVVEDILDTGHTLHFFKSHLEASRPASIKLCTLLHKPARTVADVKADYCGRTIDDHFVVGYGLDYAEKCRNYCDIMVLNG